MIEGHAASRVINDLEDARPRRMNSPTAVEGDDEGKKRFSIAYASISHQIIRLL
jgi:hypothetical protein